jgi:hypothetical protein
VMPDQKDLGVDRVRRRVTGVARVMTLAGADIRSPLRVGTDQDDLLNRASVQSEPRRMARTPGPEGPLSQVPTGGVAQQVPAMRDRGHPKAQL